MAEGAGPSSWGEDIDEEELAALDAAVERRKRSRGPEKMKRRGVYVLRLRGRGGESSYYVGSSEDIDRRVRQHRREEALPTGWNHVRYVSAMGGVEGVDPPMTAPPVLLEEANALRLWEEKEVYARMLKHGVNQVRGYEFGCGETTDIPVDQLQGLKMNLMGRYDLCRNCGTPGHFQSNCTSGKARWLREMEELVARATHQPPPPRGTDVIQALLQEQASDAQAPLNRGSAERHGQKRPRNASCAGGARRVSRSARSCQEPQRCLECNGEIPTDPEKPRCHECWRNSQKCVDCGVVIPTHPWKTRCIECWMERKCYSGESYSSSW